MTRPMYVDPIATMLQTVEERVKRNERRVTEGGSVQGSRKNRVRLHESSEILGALRNIAAGKRAYWNDQ